jgi:hypothetical protein
LKRLAGRPDDGAARARYCIVLDAQQIRRSGAVTSVTWQCCKRQLGRRLELDDAGALADGERRVAAEAGGRGDHDRVRVLHLVHSTC